MWESADFPLMEQALQATADVLCGTSIGRTSLRVLLLVDRKAFVQWLLGGEVRCGLRATADPVADSETRKAW